MKCGFLQIVATALIISGCTMPQTNAAYYSLAGSEWQPEGSSEQFVGFKAEGRLAGHGGCNRFFGSYRQASSLAEGKLALGRLGSTKKFCQDHMEAERSFLKALEKTVRYKVDVNSRMLFLYDDKGELLLKLRQSDWD
jgi:heat shock protein HslJ